MTSCFRLVALTGVVSLGLATGCASGGTRAAASERPMVTAEDIQSNPNLPIERIIQSKVPGVMVTRTPDGSLALQIRGQHAFSDSNAPLYMIDGAPFQPGPGGALTGIDPYSILSIKVLKGAEAGLYGIQGSNGVVVITTKKP